MAKKIKTKSKTTLVVNASDASGTTKPGLTCIGEICFTSDGFVVKVPEDADPECAKRIANEILRPGADIKFEFPPRAILKDKDEFVADSD